MYLALSILDTWTCHSSHAHRGDFTTTLHRLWLQNELSKFIFFKKPLSKKKKKKKKEMYPDSIRLEKIGPRETGALPRRGGKHLEPSWLA